MDFPPGVKIGVAAASVLSLWGVVEYFGFETAYQKQNRDPYQIAAQTVRLEGVRAALPEGAAIGYLTDLEPGSIGASSMFNAAQYILAPRILKKEMEEPQVLGNFSRPADFAAIGHQHGLRIEREFQNGVVLFRKEGSP